MLIFNANGKAFAEIRFGGTYGMICLDNSPFRGQFFRAIKTIPRDVLKVDIRYFGLGHEHFVPLTINSKGTEMDIQSALNDAERAATPENDKEPAKILFIAPKTEVLPDDGILTYCTIESVYDIGKVADRSVVMISEDQLPMLRCICDNALIFDVELRVLTGLPEADYTTDFDSVVWALDKVAYVPFISELKLASEIESQLAAESSTTYDREKSAYTRKTGLVKEHNKFELVKPGDEEISDDDAAVE